MSISLICVFQGEVNSFKSSLLSWLSFKELDEIIIVHFNPNKTSNDITTLDSRIKLITFSEQTTFNKFELLNVAVTICNSDYILKLDQDTILNFNLFDFCEINQHTFICDKDFLKTSHFNSVKGMLYVSKENMLKVGGFTEHNSNDEDMIHKLESIGIRHQNVLCKNNELQTWILTQINDQNFIVEKNIFKNKLENFPRTYYMSLEESIDRQEFMEKQFGNFGITLYKVISKRHSECDDIVTGKYAHTINEGTTGCIISHLKSIKHWYDNFDDEYAFFCEDDLSLETVKYWDFTWEEFMNTLPSDWDAVQLLIVRENFGDFQLRERYWDDWAAAAYIMKRDCAKRIIDTYIREDSYHLEIPNSDSMPLNENILFSSVAKTYSVPLFVEAIQFQSTYVGKDDDVVDGQKRNHYTAYNLVLNYWKTKNIQKTEFENLLTLYALDTENPEHNFNLGLWYEKEGHTAPALSYFLRCAERSEDQDLTYEALIRGSHCYGKQGERDGSSRSLLFQAQAFRSDRPEAYYLLSRYAENKEWWQDCYLNADLALRYCNFDCNSLRTDVGYPGKYGLLYEKAVSGWWWGKSEESRSLLLGLLKDYQLSENDKNIIKEKLKSWGVETH